MARSSSRPPVINAPLPLTAFAVLLIALHALRVFSPRGAQDLAFYAGALFPDRFWSWAAGGPTQSGVPAYDGALDAAAPLFLSALLHGDWFHVVLNAAFLVALGKPVYEALRYVYNRRTGQAALSFFLFFFITQAAGGIAYLLYANPVGALTVGASGGVSGLLAAVLLLRPDASGRVLSRDFLAVTVIFIAGNMLLAFMGPSLLGAGIAWQVHIGSYLAGAVLTRATMRLQRLS